MMDQSLISVIIIFLNARWYIQEAIQSVYDQTYPHWELVLVDDGSTDGSSEVAKSLADQSSGRIRYVDHPGHRNLGMSASRNIGIDNAKGELIALLDADDVWVPRKLDQQIAILKKYSEVAMVYGRTLHWRSWNTGTTPRQRDAIPALGIRPERVYQPGQLTKLLHKMLRGRILSPSMSNVCFRRELFDRTGGFEVSFPGMYEDQVFIAKVFLKEAVYVSAELWDQYRIHPDSCVAVSDKMGLSPIAREDFLRGVEHYLWNEGLRGRSTSRAVRMARWENRHPTIARTYNAVLNVPAKIFRLARLISGIGRGEDGR